MIACLRGKILHREINRVVVDVQGVGYDVAVSLATLETLPQDGDVFLYIHTAVRENALELYGFHGQQEKALFEMLLTVAGIGPRTSLQILSGIAPEGFCRAVLEKDLHKLTSIPGIGKKSAERIVVELSEKIRKMDSKMVASSGAPATTLEQDLVSSLVNLGYKEKVAAAAASRVVADAGSHLQLTDAVRLALKDLMK